MIPNKTLTFRLTAKLKDKLSKDAQDAGLSLSEYLRMRLADDAGDYVLRNNGDVILRNSDIPSGLLSKLRRIAKGNRQTVAKVIVRLVAKRLGVYVP